MNKYLTDKELVKAFWIEDNKEMAIFLVSRFFRKPKKDIRRLQEWELGTMVEQVNHYIQNRKSLPEIPKVDIRYKEDIIDNRFEILDL